MNKELSIIQKEGGIDNAIQALLATNPDLIIEGATGTRPLLKNMVKAQSAIPYVGLDLNWEIIEPGEFTRYGNCVLPEDVVPVIQEHTASQVALVTWNALPAILGNKIALWEKKDRRDILGEKRIIENMNGLFSVQMHFLIHSLVNQVEGFYAELQDNGWQLTSYDTDHETMLLVR